MNQILWTCDMNNSVSKKRNYFIFLFFMFLLLFIFCLIFFIYSHFYKNDDFSNRLVNNYNISQLYNNISPSYINTNGFFSVIGIIKIPKIDIVYPILSNYSEDNLNIAPCKLSGPDLNEYGNLCIVGHNYNNSLFFSNLGNLNVDDKIIVYDLEGIPYYYCVTSVYEVPEDDTSVLSYSNDVELTLITCNNSNSNMIIVKSKLDLEQ